tara:strand:+ start:646 stop:813 length:168 start_codon:yes stop_codon:yes gene_type:complete
MPIPEKIIIPAQEERGSTMKLSEFKKKFGEGTEFDLDWGKLVILGLCIYIAIQVT